MTFDELWGAFRERGYDLRRRSATIDGFLLEKARGLWSDRLLSHSLSTLERYFYGISDTLYPLWRQCPAIRSLRTNLIQEFLSSDYLPMPRVYHRIYSQRFNRRYIVEDYNGTRVFSTPRLFDVLLMIGCVESYIAWYHTRSFGSSHNSPRRPRTNRREPPKQKKIISLHEEFFTRNP